MYFELTSFYGIPCRIVVNGGQITKDGVKVSEELRLKILRSLYEFKDIVENMVESKA